MTTTRKQRLMPKGVPKWIRAYDNGGADNGGSIDRFTVCFTGNYQRNLWKDGKLTEQRPGYQGRMESFRRPNRHPHLAMNCAPFHPQGFGQHGESDKMIDVNKWGFAPMLGRKNHLGTRIPFKELPEDCRKLVISDYKEIWSI